MRAGNAGRDRRGEHRDAGTGAAGEEEADRVDEERVGEHEHDDREREDPHTGGRATEVQRRHRARGHRAGAEHRRLPARHRAEHHQQRDAGNQLCPERQTAQQRPREREDERDVGAGHGEQMRQARGAELLLDVTGQLPRVAEEEAGHQRALRRRQVPATGENPGAEKVGRAVQRRTSGVERAQLDGVEARHGVPPSEALVVAAEGLEPPRHLHLVTRLEESQLSGGVATGGDEHGSCSGGASADAGDAGEDARVVLPSVGVVGQRRRDRRRGACVPGGGER